MTIVIYDRYVDARNLISAMMSLKGQLELPILVTAKSNSWPLRELCKLRDMHFVFDCLYLEWWYSDNCLSPGMMITLYNIHILNENEDEMRKEWTYSRCCYYVYYYLVIGKTIFTLHCNAYFTPVAYYCSVVWSPTMLENCTCAIWTPSLGLPRCLGHNTCGHVW